MIMKMRRYLLIASILFSLPLVLAGGQGWAQQCSENQLARLSLPVVGGSVPVASSACPSGTWTYAYNGDYTADTDAACDSAGAKLDGTLSATPPTVTSSYVTIVQADRYIQHTIDATELSTAAGTICFSFKIDDATGDTDGNVETVQFMEIGVADVPGWSTANRIFLEAAGDGSGAGRIVGYHIGNTTEDTVLTAADGVSVNAWYRACYSWQPGRATADHAIGVIACGGGGTQADCAGKNGWNNKVEVDDDIVELTAQPAVIRIGEYRNGESMTDDVFVADVFIMSGWEATDPF